MVFRWFWGLATIGNDGFRWFSTIGPRMEWLPTIVEVYSPPNLQVDLEASVVDTDLKQMTVRYKDGGIIEELLGQ